ncbi:non-ribosomal peptide synthetase [Pseudovibrio sp. WM33]|uniref:non-ribosomal peptide synthetase n=1 Tax=Pseudovibrio sp. WM33 TaxID=1735585 RepID=UPI0007AE56BB|nr:non-ribosomal peptide synthetase [Pseudovibrio sp. WM33]KZL22640.1 Surfactin synthase subunit 2 [Pseudovibrio sp. WM33]
MTINTSHEYLASSSYDLEIGDQGPVQSSLLDSISFYADHFPELAAVQDHDRILNYKELNERSAQVASALRGHGVKNGDVVAVCLPRSQELIVVMLAILKAGATVVPLDAASPPDRQSAILSDSQTRFLIVPEASASTPFSQQAHQVLPADQLLIQSQHENSGDLPRHPLAKTAFLFYTSGTTGTPKGVQVPLSAIERLAHQPSFVPMNIGDRYAHISNPAFDALSFDVWVPLLTGGCSVIFSSDELADFAGFARQLEQQSISTMFMTVSLFNAMVDHGTACFGSLGHLLIGGEQLNPKTVEKWYAANPESACQIYNIYGPTECATFALCFAIPRDFDADIIPIGSPIASTDCQLRSSNGEITNTGETGELYLGGAGVAHGYLNRTEETQRRFVELPNSGKWYSTGDLVRLNQQGLVEYVGRVDRQIKVRGFRVEPEEIEQRIQQYPKIQQACVLAAQEQGKPLELHAYLASEEQLDYEELDAHFSAYLPDYMRPHKVFCLGSLPLNANGKIDQKALQEMETTPFRRVSSCDASESAVLSSILQTAEMVLSVAQLSREETLLTAGGDSLKAISLSNQLNTVFGCRVAPSQLLNLTFAELSEIVSEHNEQANSLPPAPAPSGLAKEQATSEQMRLWLQQQKNPADISYNTPFIFRFSGHLSAENLGHATYELVKKHPALRTSFHPTDDGVQQRVAESNPEVFHFHGTLEEEAISQLQTKLLTQPFDLEHPCLFQLHLVHQPNGTSVLLFHAHHIILDGWSLNILFEDLSRSFQAETDETGQDQKPIGLTTLDFATWQSHLWETEHYNKQKDALFKLYDAPEIEECWKPVLRHAQGKQGVLAGQTRLTRLDAATRAKLLTIAKRLSLTPHQVFHALFAHALYVHTGRTSFTIASPVANRLTTEFEATVGMFANTALVPVKIDPTASIQQNTSTLTKASKQVLACQDVAFEHVVEHLQKRKRISGVPFEFMFATENTRYETLKLNGECAQLSYPEDVAPKCPLYLSVLDEAETYQFYWEYDLSHFDNDAITLLEQTMFAGLDHMETEEAAANVFQLNTQQRISHVTGTSQSLPYTTVASWFQKQVSLSPHAPALAWRGKTLTYHELDELSDALAANMQSTIFGSTEPVGPTRVALYMDASPDYIVSLLAVTKLGVTAVPLDLSYPQKLLEDVISQAQPVGVLHAVQASLPSALERQDLRALPVDLQELRNSRDHQHPLKFSDRERPLYTLFTSGSTGQPKGVDVYNQTLCNLLHWQQQQGGLPAGEHTMQFSKLAFDVSFQEIFSTLCSGGCFHVIDPLWRQDMQCLLNYMYDNNLQRIFMPFVALELFCEAAQTFNIFPGALKNVITAGEQLYCTKALRAFFTQLRQASLHNHYGPTETHVVCAHSMHGPAANWPTRPPIGAPVHNTDILIVDDSFHPVPSGERGQLLIGGNLVHRCYLDNAVLNAERFVILQPDCGTGGSKLYYKTGDMGFLDELGQVNYGGRHDQQVKISGHRVELGQLEASLINHGAIEQASVVFDDQHKKLHAYVSLRVGTINADELDHYLSTQLPDYIRVDEFRQVDEWPRAPSGKINQRALASCKWRKIERKKRKINANNAIQRTNELIAAFEHVTGASITADQTFFEAGCSSLQLMRYQMHINKALEGKVSIADLFRYVTPSDLAEHLEGKTESETRTSKAKTTQSAGKVAIIGMALRVPGADDLAEFWSMVRENRSGIEHFTPEDPDFVGARSQMSEMMSFDPEYFGISPREAALMDPQQRHFLMSCVHALENAGIPPLNTNQNIGVIASSGETTYYHAALRSKPPTALPDKFQMALHHEKDFLATKVAFQLDLKGPAITLQAACGSSLIGIHTAAGMLRNGECDVMLAGGVLVDPDMSEGYKYQSQHIFSKDGNCSPFSKDASGTIGASGVGVVVLKSLDRARADGNRIYAVIEGSAVNNDGRSKMNYTSPSVSGQESVIRQALTNAGVRGDQVGYVEAHGTGTQLGDPIEVQALSSAYGNLPEASCALSSVKSQIGHLGAGAGVLGLIRAALSIYHGYVPPNLGFKQPNQELGLDQKGFYIPTNSKKWEDTCPRYAGVSSFGIGGTNAHVVIGEASEDELRRYATTKCLVLSAHTKTALFSLAENIKNYLEHNPTSFQLILSHLQASRRAHPWRFAVDCDEVEEAIEALGSFVPHYCDENKGACDPASLTATDWLEGKEIESQSAGTPPPWDLPGYCFELQQYNVLELPAAKSKASENLPKRLPEEQWLSQMVWQPVCRVGSCQTAQRSKTAVVLYDPNNVSDDFAAFNAVYHRVVPVCYDGRISGAHSGKLSVDPFSRDAVEDLLRHLSFMNLGELDWLHALPLSCKGEQNELDSLQEAKKVCLDSLTYVLQAHSKYGLTISRICLLSYDAAPVNGAVAQPLRGLLAGPLSVIHQEFGIQTLWLDLEDTKQGFIWSEVAFALSLEQVKAQCLALRNGFVWECRILPLSQNGPTTEPTKLDAPALFVVTGGSGAIGTQVCKSLLADPHAQIAIISRNPRIPEELLQFNTRIHLIQADIGKPATWSVTFESVTRLGMPVAGVIHASGVGEGNLISFRDPIEIYNKMLAKYEGSIFVERFIEVFKPTRAIYCSSMSAILGGAGQLDYASSNALMDSFAHYKNPLAPDTIRTTINWDIWSESGIATHSNIQDGLHQKHLELGLSNKEGLRTFSRVLHTTVPQVLISTCDVEKARYFYRSLVRNEIKSDARTIKANKLNLIREQIETLFLQQLGLDQIAPDECLYDLGMDSLTLLDVVSLLEHYDIRVLLSQIPKNTSLDQIMNLVERQHKAIPSSPNSTWADAVVPHQWHSGEGDEVVVLIHPIGGDVESYRELAGKLPDNIGITVIADPALTNPSLPKISLKERAAVYAEAIAERLANKRIHLVGWSFGSWVAQEMALCLSKQQRAPGNLTLIDPPAPNSGEHLKLMNEQEVEVIFLKELKVKWPDKRALVEDSRERKAYQEALVRCTKANLEAMAHHIMSPAPFWQTSVFLASETAKGLRGTQNTTSNSREIWLKLLPDLHNWQIIEADHYSILMGETLDHVLAAAGLVKTLELV